jgi:flagella basal body P-ring formation protein FlgA
LHDNIEKQVLSWASQQSELRGKNLHLPELDARLKISACQQTLQIEQPFPNQPAIRVRCPEPIWQIYVTLQEGSGAVELTRASPSTPVTNVRQVLIAKEMLKRGTLLSASMFTSTSVNIGTTPENQFITDASSIVNMELMHDLIPNTPLKLYDVRAAVLVKRGQEVVVSTGQGHGFLITLRAEALQDGSLGEQIHLKNSESGRTLSAVVTGPQEAQLK